MAIDFIRRQKLQQIIEQRDDICISIYLPMQRKGAGVQGNAVRLKNALKEAAEALKERGYDQAQIDASLARPRALLDDPQYWQRQQDGLALFTSRSFFESFRLPTSFDPLTVIAERFHIKPLLPLFSDDGRFYILALSQAKVRLFRGTHHMVDEMDIDQAPGSLAEALAYDDPEEQLQHHVTTSGTASAGGPEVVHHGHGVPDNERRARLRRFLQQVSKGIQDVLAEEEVPLILAAVDYLHPIYKEVDSSAHLLDEGIEGNPDEMTAEELHDQAWKIVAPLFVQAREDVRTRYLELANGDQATDDLHAIVPAAYQGRVDSLFVALNEQKWGKYNPDTNDIVVHKSPEDESEDLLDFAAVQTMANGGTVYAVDETELPGQTAIAAVFRF